MNLGEQKGKRQPEYLQNVNLTLLHPPHTLSPRPPHLRPQKNPQLLLIALGMKAQCPM